MSHWTLSVPRYATSFPPARKASKRACAVARFSGGYGKFLTTFAAKANVRTLTMKPSFTTPFVYSSECFVINAMFRKHTHKMFRTLPSCFL